MIGTASFWDCWNFNRGMVSKSRLPPRQECQCQFKFLLRLVVRPERGIAYCQVISCSTRSSASRKLAMWPAICRVHRYRNSHYHTARRASPPAAALIPLIDHNRSPRCHRCYSLHKRLYGRMHHDAALARTTPSPSLNKRAIRQSTLAHAELCSH